MKTRTVTKKKQSVVPSTEPVHASLLWTIRGQKYDLRAFVARHPGGVHAIECGQGRDCTSMFESYHSFSTMHYKTLAAFKYDGPVLGFSDSYKKEGKDVENSYFDWDNTPFYDEARVAARKHFSPLGNESHAQVRRNTKASWSATAQHAIGFIVTLYVFGLWLKGWRIVIPLFPFLYWIVGSSFMHNGSHFAMSTLPWVNNLSAYVGSFHVQFHLWTVQHVIGHHVHTNVVGMDPDVHHFEHARPKEKYAPGYRLHAEQAYLPKYRLFWRASVAIQATMTTIGVCLLNIPLYLELRAFQTTSIPDKWLPLIKKDRWLLFAACGLFCYFHGLGTGVFTLFWTWAVHGVLFNIFSQISHVNEHCMEETEKYRLKHGLEKNEWAVHQMLTTTDYACNSRLWALLSNDLNNQMCHHLFPSVHPCHYPALREKLLPIAKKHGIDYEGRSDNTFLDCVGMYWTWLFRLNERSTSISKHTITDSSKASCLALLAFTTFTFLLPAFGFGILL